MNVCIRNTFVSLWLYFGALSLSAQGACFYLPFINDVPTGSNRLMPVKCINLDSVLSLQLLIRWDPTVLRYLTIDQLGIPGLAFNDFNAANAIDSGYVRLQFEGNTSLPPGTSVPDSSTVFRLRFNVIGPDTSSTPVKITELLTFPPLIYELIKVRPDTSAVGYYMGDCAHTNGFVAVGYTVSASEPQATALPISVAPNPFLVSTSLQYFLDESADIQIVICNMLGQVVFQKQVLNQSAGQHGMVIENGMLGAAGVYSLTIRAGQKFATQKIISQ